MQENAQPSPGPMRTETVPSAPPRAAIGGRLPDGIRAIRKPQPEEMVRALQPLWDKSPDGGRLSAQRFIEYAQSHGIALDQCWTCEHEKTGRLRPTCLAIPNPGRTALIFCSDLAEKRQFPALTALLECMTKGVDIRRIRILQALLTRQEKRSREVFAAAGFDHLAELSYMERKIRSGSSLAQRERDHESARNGQISFEPFREETIEDFKHALGMSYTGTLDCPQLCGLRSLDDILRGHRATGEFDPDLWTLARCGGKPAAVLLLSPFPTQGIIELTYLGVGEGFRGRGIGRMLVHRAIDQAARMQASRITLAVDDANAPALKLYRCAGFERIDRRTAMIYPVAAHSNSPGSVG